MLKPYCRNTELYNESCFGNAPRLVSGYPLLCTREDLPGVLLAVGADNLEVFDAVIHNPMKSMSRS